MNVSRIKHCPFCDSLESQVMERTLEDNESAYYVHCSQCKCCGPYVLGDKEMCISLWNMSTSLGEKIALVERMGNQIASLEKQMHEVLKGL